MGGWSDGWLVGGGVGGMVGVGVGGSVGGVDGRVGVGVDDRVCVVCHVSTPNLLRDPFQRIFYNIFDEKEKKFQNGPPSERGVDT